MRFLLEVEGWDVCDFKSPVEFLENLSPGCLVLEQDLPGMTGLDLVERLRSHGMTLPVVLTTARQDAGFVARATAAGANAVDPLSPEDVIEAISATLAAPFPLPTPCRRIKHLGQIRSNSAYLKPWSK
jgi:FixJ family two-component response regulator